MIKFLYGIKKIENFNHCSSEFAITEAWMKRWLVERIKRKETLDKLKSLNSQTVSSKFDKIVYKYSSDNDQNLNLFSNLSS